MNPRSNENFERPTAATAVSSMVMLMTPAIRRPWAISLRNGIATSRMSIARNRKKQRFSRICSHRV